MPPMSSSPTINLATEPAAIAACFPVVQQLRPHLVAADFVARIQRMQRDEGFRLAALTDGSGAVRAVAGYRFYEKLFSGKNLYVDDLVTDGAARSQGHGRALLAWLKREAVAHGCDQLELDSGVQRFAAHRFYFRERMHISAYHFVAALRA